MYEIISKVCLLLRIYHISVITFELSTLKIIVEILCTDFFDQYDKYFNMVQDTKYIIFKCFSITYNEK